MDLEIRGDDIDITLSLSPAINTPVALVLRYMEVIGDEGEGEEEGGVVMMTTMATYNNTDLIVNRELNSSIPYERFRVGVALMSSELGVDVLGPFIKHDRIFGKETSIQGLGVAPKGGQGGDRTPMITLGEVWPPQSQH